MAHVIAFVDDLFFQAKLVETAKQLSVELRSCATPDALATEIATGSAPKLVIVDLNARNGPIEVIENLQTRAPEIPLVAFLSHVQTDLAERARAAGCREVMPSSYRNG